MAVVVRADDSVTEQAVLDHVSGKLAKFKQPKKVEFIDAIPRNPTGKVLKRVLRDQFAGVTAE
jgi:acyl-CoA synthetase (AMP-forming)/AMP-acid ligase II